MGRSGGNCCCIVNCGNRTNNTTNVRFYSFSVRPYKLEQREKWIKAVQRVNSDGSPWQPSKHSKICSAHFIDNAKSDHPLSPSFVPTIFPSCYSKSKPTEKYILGAKRRFQNSLKKRKNTEEISEGARMSDPVPIFKEANEVAPTVFVDVERLENVAHSLDDEDYSNCILGL